MNNFLFAYYSKIIFFFFLFEGWLVYQKPMFDNSVTLSDITIICPLVMEKEILFSLELEDFYVE